MRPFVLSFTDRAVAIAAGIAMAAAVLVAGPGIAGAQSCPTAGDGTTCFGGQFYCASTRSCYDAPSCAGNQVFSCDACGCVCNTASYPCGGCTAASSTQGSSCGGNPSCPSGGVYSNQCSVVGCPSGTTLCPTPSPGQCVANRSCPAGTTWDVCADQCVTPNVLLSPSFVQSGYVQINGEIRSTAGNLRLDSATGAGAGDLYLASGKALRVDGSGVTGITLGNWGVGGTGANLSVLGLLLPRGLSTIPSDAAVAAHANGTIETGQLCLGNGTACRTTWPAAADFNPTYVNVSGSESMTGPLAITGAGTNLTLSGAAGAAGTPKMQITAPATNEGLRIVSAADASPLNIRNSTNTADIFRVDQTGTLAVGSVPWARLTSFPSACGAGQFVTGVGGSLTCAAPTGVGGSGSTNYLPKFTASTTLGNSQIFDNGTNVGIGTSVPGQKLDVNGTVRATSFVTAGGQAIDPLPTGTSGQTLRHNGTSWVGNSVLFNNGTNVGVGTSSPGAKLDVVGTGGTTVDLRVNGRIQTGGSTGGGVWVNNPATMFVGAQDSSTVGLYNGGAWRLSVASGGNVGIGSTAPTARLDVQYAGALGSGDNTARFYGGTGNYSHIHYGTTGDWYVRSALSSGKVVLQDTGGNVGIGTSSPSYKLTVAGTTRVDYSGSYTGAVRADNPSGYGYGVYGTAGYVGVRADGDGIGAYGTSTNGYGISGYSQNGRGVTGGTDYGRGGSFRSNYSSGHALYIEDGRSYFNGNIGVYNSSPSYALDVSGTTRTSGMVLGGVYRSSWPSLDVTTARTDCSYCNGWHYVYCPGGYELTGAFGYNCRSNGGVWGCSQTWAYETYAGFYVENTGSTAYTQVRCARVN